MRGHTPPPPCDPWAHSWLLGDALRVHVVLVIKPHLPVVCESVTCLSDPALQNHMEHSWGSCAFNAAPKCAAEQGGSRTRFHSVGHIHTSVDPRCERSLLETSQLNHTGIYLWQNQHQENTCSCFQLMWVYSCGVSGCGCVCCSLGTRNDFLLL